MKPKLKTQNGHLCISCNNTYRKQDFTLCPFCGGDGGAITARVWKPSKKQRKQFAKKQSVI